MKNVELLNSTNRKLLRSNRKYKEKACFIYVSDATESFQNYVKYQDIECLKVTGINYSQHIKHLKETQTSYKEKLFSANSHCQNL